MMKCRDSVNQERQCRNDSNLDLDCFGKHLVTSPQYRCTWRPSRGPSVKNYTLFIRQAREWSRISLSLSPRKMDFIKCLTLKLLRPCNEQENMQHLHQHHQHLRKHHSECTPKHERGALGKWQLGRLHKSLFPGVTTEPS